MSLFTSGLVLFIVKLKVKFQLMNLQTSSGILNVFYIKMSITESSFKCTQSSALSLTLILAHFLTYTHFHDLGKTQGISHIPRILKLDKPKIKLFK